MPQWLVHPQINAQYKSQPQTAIFCWFCVDYVKSYETESQFKQQGTPSLSSAMTVSNNNISEGRIHSHTPAMFSSKTNSAYEILQYLFVDNGVFLFGTWSSMQEGMELIFIRFGIEMHMGCEKTVCKTKHVFSPPPPKVHQNMQNRDGIKWWNSHSRVFEVVVITLLLFSHQGSRMKQLWL